MAAINLFDDRSVMNLLRIVLVASTCLLGACPEPVSRGESQEAREVAEVEVEFEQELVLETSVLTFRLFGTERVVADEARVSMQGVIGAVDSLSQTWSGELIRPDDVGELSVALDAPSSLWQEVSGLEDTSFAGDITVELSLEGGVVAVGRLDDVELVLRRTVAPTIRPFEVGDVYVDQRISVTTSGVLRPEEGATVAIFERGSVDAGAGRVRDLEAAQLELAWAGSRERGLFPVDPEIFGVHPGRFEGTVRFENHFRDGTVVSGTRGVELAGAIQPTFIARLSPQAGSRGQKISLIGRGLIATDDQAGHGMFMRYEGVFDPDDPPLAARRYEGEDALVRGVDEVLDEEEAVQGVWYEVTDDRRLDGLGAVPGVFEGQITPVLFDELGQVDGVAWQGSFRILPTKQVVYLKYLPAFSRGLEAYGIRNVEREVRDRVLEVVRRDYEGFNVEFREESPVDFVDFATIEIGGPDPSGRRAFGYDNSFNGVAKDTGNLYLADYLGGVNAQAAAEFNNPYGGIFIESFSFFSQELNPTNSYASPEFDRVFGPFMPDLGGSAVRGTEWPDGPRREAIAEAIHVTGSVIGNTVTHELGHSLGLAYFRGDENEPGGRFHNEDFGKFIMDPGGERPFTERAEIEGEAPAVFNARNRAYLERYLPAP